MRWTRDVMPNSDSGMELPNLYLQGRIDPEKLPGKHMDIWPADCTSRSQAGMEARLPMRQIPLSL